jgi:hypothetical protein
VAADRLDGEALRAGVIAASQDPRVRAMLGAAEVTAVATEARWEASEGGVRGYAVELALCAEDLAALDASPGTRDLLEHGFAVAVAASPRRSMVSLRTRWNGRGAAHAGTYREVARAAVEVTLEEGLRRYASARGEGLTTPDGLRVTVTPARIEVRTDQPVARDGRRRLEEALRAMLGPGRVVRWSP